VDKVLFLAATHGHRTCINKVFEAEVINALGREDNVGARSQDLLNLLLGNVEFTKRAVQRMVIAPFFITAS